MRGCEGLREGESEMRSQIEYLNFNKNAKVNTILKSLEFGEDQDPLLKPYTTSKKV